MIKLILIFLFSFSAFAATMPNNEYVLGKGSSTAEKGFIFDTGDGASNPKLKVNDSQLLFYDKNEFRIGNGSNTTDKNIIFNTGDGANNPVMGYSTDKDKLIFKNRNGGAIEIGSGQSSGNILEDPSFESGVSEWSCTNATVTQAAGGVDGDFQTQIDFTADGGFCQLVSAVSGDTANQEYLSSAYVKTSDATVKLQFLDGTRLVVEPEVLADGSYLPYAAQVIPSTSLITKITGDNTDQAFVDAAGHTLGGFNRAASKSCTDELDCANEFSAKVSSTGVVSDKNVDWIDGDCAVTDASLFTCNLKGFSEPPNCTATDVNPATGSGSVVRMAEQPTADTLVIRTGTTSASTSFSKTALNFHIDCSRGDDYKTKEDQGVVIVPDNGDAKLIAYRTTTQTIGNATVNFEPDNVETSYFSWDGALFEATAQSSGEYVFEFDGHFDGTGSFSNVVLILQIDSGAGYVDTPVKCGAGTGTDDRNMTQSCTHVATLEKGDKVRYRFQAFEGSVILRAYGGTAGVWTITPLGSTKPIGEFAAKRILGAERKTPDTIGGEPIYEYCNEVATDITSTSTIETIASGLEPVNSINYTGSSWTIISLTSGGTNAEVVNIFYDSATGVITGGTAGTWKIGAGTVYCLKYLKP